MFYFQHRIYGNLASLGKAFVKILADVFLITFPTTLMASLEKRRRKRFCRRPFSFTLPVSFQPSLSGSSTITTLTAKSVRFYQNEFEPLKLIFSKPFGQNLRRQEGNNGANDRRSLFRHFWRSTAFDSSNHRPTGALYKRYFYSVPICE